MVARDLGIASLYAASRRHQLQMAGTAAHARDAHSLRAGDMPISPAKPWLPRTNRPWPGRSRRRRCPCRRRRSSSGISPAGSTQRASPSAWACTSLSTDTGSSQDSCKRSLMGWPVHPGHNLVGIRDAACDRIHAPGGGTPMPSTCSGASAPRQAPYSPHRTR